MRPVLLSFTVVMGATLARADVGDPQTKTDHPWYPGELSCSTFERLFATQAELYKRVVGTEPKTDEEKALASWFWRNTHYWHGTEGGENYWGKGYTAGGDMRSREYWTGLFAHGYGLCGTTHSQYTAEMEYLLGHGRGRGVGVEGHNSFEAWLTGGPYGSGKWVLLDHDISTVIYDVDGKALLSIPEVKADLERLADPAYKPEKQHGWLVAGLHPKDALGVYSRYDVAEYLSGYAGPTPIIHLRRGESLRRYFRPGLGEQKKFVFWGFNYNAGGIPGPARPQTWVNQPEKMFQARSSSPYHEGQARYANAVFTYKPDFRTADYKEGVVDESPRHVVLEFVSPYIIGCSPPNPKEWGIYDAGGKNGLVIEGKVPCSVSVSVDHGKTWKQGGTLEARLDLTDQVKGYRQYWLKLGAGPSELAGAELSMTTVCESNSSTIPQLKDGGTRVTFESSGNALVSAGPTLEQGRAHLLDGDLPSPRATLKISTPRHEAIASIFAAAQVASSCPPSPEIKYQIEYSLDDGESWKPLVKDWTVARRGHEPGDFWSQSLVYGRIDLGDSVPKSVAWVRFRNDGGKTFLRAEAHLLYRSAGHDSTRVTFRWNDSAGSHEEFHDFPPGKPPPWELKTGTKTETYFVDYGTLTP